ncbi:MAG: Re/Si-specific NAD(P)(+) transhydrogenase subunit alpha [Gemmatimonadetes bacterium]|nr:Re/Si-specific NAD(P)(+) transhydrogenase subunit alpha [Gemmatimonadota bacterium]NIR77898.1 Re/Si-specific NAD(P)(+) transhydrogenase subunit alpha [Gemmatimonadota bacterium]NIT86443.1 Re/Si-specific NAD(P)(+) transhydrogenase subunit alpha [Gemmatimonadota bacterium]NIU30280.1 Re/Si-specific NAD(P)(+) transhydrogenase subunit alpha [Gemmatimonadota bacterium]NIU35184.1 Re/Si-specific NAD(P)(+) transhydrogenase subunit alpha [Gemmatimonadota bacterium]
MRVAVLGETRPHERRVALVPDVVESLKREGVEVTVEAGAGVPASFLDDAFREAGARVVESAREAIEGAGAVLRVQPPAAGDGGAPDEIAALPRGIVHVSFLWPVTEPGRVRRLADAGVTAFAMELMPRITRAQKMDALSSQATVAGYKAVLLGANALGKFLPMLMTAAGTIRPARILVLGAGVAGLQAIATARRLGAVVEAFDVRPAVKEQVESLGATFLEAELDEAAEDEGGYAKELSEEQHERELELIASHIDEADVVVTTAQIPGREAPLLITEEMVRTMRPGSVVVDLASESGGNCALTRHGETLERHGVTIMGPANLPSELPFHASQMYARNVSAFLLLLVEEGELALDFDDEIVAGTCVTHEGEIRDEGARDALEGKSDG